ncbi:MAG TPA: FixH family protein [Polyangiaceae bacterium]|jgi:hypothetical protein|nr:FixH family protein [Polyangiaceae bacterium]
MPRPLQICQMILRGAHRLAALAASAALLCACSHAKTDAPATHDNSNHDAAAEAGADDCVAQYGALSAGHRETAVGGGFSILLTKLTPQSPQLGDNTWDFTLTDASDDPLPGVIVRLSAWMPAHAHGSLKTVIVDDLGTGHYHAAPVNFHMPGRWDVTVTVELPTGDDHVTLITCVAP